MYTEAMLLYSYVVLFVGCYASFCGAPEGSVLAVGTMLALPNIAKIRGQDAALVQGAAHSIHALIFAVVAHAIGRGIAVLSRTYS